MVTPVLSDEGVGAGQELSRRRLLWMLGAGTAGGVALAAQQWVSAAGAVPRPADPTIPTPSVPDVTLVQPTTTPTVDDLAASLDWDTERMFRFVADEIAYESYAGALRGPTGTLWAMAGNSVDQALLLGALLAAARVPTRFAIGELTNDVAESLMAPAVDLTTARERAARVLLPPDVAEAWTHDGPWKRNPDFEPLLAVARVQLDASVRLIDDALAAAGIVLPDAASALPRAELGQHVWIQYADGPNWIDLDPSAPDAQPATSHAAAAQTVDVLDDDSFHSVEIRVVAEVVTAGVPTRTTLLTHQVRCADVQGVPIFIAHGPAEWLGIAAAITGEQQYLPMVLVGDELVEGAVLTLTSGGGVLDALGEESGGAEGQTLAEWLEIDVRVPGGDVRSAVRNVFDRVSPSDRESGILDLSALAPIELTHIDDEIGDIFLPFSGPIIVSVAGQPLPWSAFDIDVLPTDVAAADDTGLMVSCAQAFHFIRDICGLEFLPTLGHHFYADQPTVLAMFLAPTAILGEGTQNVTFGVDILSAHHGASVVQGTASPIHAGIAAGVLDHVAERLLVEGLFSLPEAPPLIAVSVGLVFEQAAADGVPVITLQPDSREAMPDVPPSVRAHIDAALDLGRVVIVPARRVTVAGEPHIGWWEIDPESGHTVDRLDNGRSASLGEIALLLWRVIKATACYRAVGSAVLFVVRAAMGSIDTVGNLAFSYATMAGSAIGCAFA